MHRSTSTEHRAFLEMAIPVPVKSPLPVPLPQLVPYQRCTCGSCRECHDNAKWDRIFAKFEAKEPDVRGVYRCALRDL